MSERAASGIMFLVASLLLLLKSSYLLSERKRERELHTLGQLLQCKRERARSRSWTQSRGRLAAGRPEKRYRMGERERERDPNEPELPSSDRTREGPAPSQRASLLARINSEPNGE